MDFIAPDPKEEALDTDAIIVKADEVDEAGADISAISPTNASESEFNERIENRRQHDAQTSSPKLLANAVPSPPRVSVRPLLKREGSAPSPPKQPPPPAPSKEIADLDSRPPDSLSLQQLKKLVGDLHKVEPTAYAYEYSETGSFVEEIQEWFVYNEEERLMLLQSREDFEQRWIDFSSNLSKEGCNTQCWVEASNEDRKAFTDSVLRDLECQEDDDIAGRVKDLECLSYIGLGAWGDTAGLPVEIDRGAASDPKWQGGDIHERSDPQSQVSWMKSGALLLCQVGAINAIVKICKKLWDSEQSVSRLLLWLSSLVGDS